MYLEQSILSILFYQPGFNTNNRRANFEKSIP